MEKSQSNLLFSQTSPCPINSIGDLSEACTKLQGGVHFRGHFDRNWGLTPTIARLHTRHYAGEAINEADNKQLQESLLLHRFRRHTYPHYGRILNEWEVLFLARHHDLPVRLIDWTSNPLVALYFACKYAKEEENTSDGAIWWFTRPTREMHVDVFEPRSPFEYQGVQLVFPFYPTMRMTAQSGVFTLHSPDYWTDLTKVKKKDFKDKCEAKFDLVAGGMWIVPKQQKRKILKDLDRFGINARVLFPELDGLAQGLMHTERFRDLDQYPAPETI